MELLQAAGYTSSVLVGISLGLMGGGGSILTVPIMVYLFGFNPVLATAYSLFVVGSTSLVGSFRFMRRKRVTYQAALVYGIPSVLTIFLTRKWLVPAIPDPVVHLGSFIITKNVAIMVFFALIMLVAAISMMRDKSPKNHEKAPKNAGFNAFLLALQGALVGVVTGIVGAGGGFLIVPALVLLAKLPMKTAIGTSLVVISANSLIGFLGDVSRQAIDWPFLLIFTGLSVIGIIIGSYLSRKIPGEKLKKGFGIFILVMGVYIMGHEILL